MGGVDVPDAVVHMGTGADTVTLRYEPPKNCAELWTEWPDNVGCYQAALENPVAPGQTWDLEVLLADGTRATGRTTVPQRLELETPTAGESQVVECGDPIGCGGPLYTQPVIAEWVLRWSTPEPPGLRIALEPAAVFLDDAAYPGDTCRFSSFSEPRLMAADSAVWRLSRIDCLDPLRPARFDSIHADLVVHTLNHEYRRYVEAMNDETVRADAAAEGVDGAWGVFGAVTPVRVGVVLVRNPPPGPPPKTR